MKELTYILKEVKDKKYAFWYDTFKLINHNQFDLADILDNIFKQFDVNKNYMIIRSNRAVDNLECLYKQNELCEEKPWMYAKREILRESLKKENLKLIDHDFVVPITLTAQGDVYFLIFDNTDSKFTEQDGFITELIYLVLRTYETNRLLTTYTMIDPLTGVFNFNYFQKALSTEIAKIERIAYNSVFSVILFDIKGFDAINEEYGFAFGDEVLKHISKCINDKIRSTDEIYRYGADEFAVICTYANKEITKEHILKRIADEIKHKKICVNNTPKDIDVSVAIVEYGKGLNKNDFIKKLNSAIQKAKDTNSLIIE